jgi:hypothetical protein
MTDFPDVPNDPGNISTVTELVQLYVVAARVVEELEAQLQVAKDRVNDLQLNQIPGAMDALGMADTTLQDGTKVTVKQDVNVSIPVEMRPRAYAWLRANGASSIVRNEVTVDLRGADQSRIDHLCDIAREVGGEPVLGESVHAATLKSHVKGMLEQGVQPPPALFSVHQFKKAAIKGKR